MKIDTFATIHLLNRFWKRSDTFATIHLLNRFWKRSGRFLTYPKGEKRQSPEQVTPRVATSPNNWDQLQNIRTFYQPLDFNLLNQQLAEAHLTTSDSSDSSDTEDEMANAIIDYLEDNLHNNTSLRIDPFYGDGTQNPLQWMIHFEKVARNNAWDEAKKIRKYTTYLEDDNKWLRELENNHQQQEETINAYYARFKRLVKWVEINVDQHKRLFIKGLLPHIAPLVTMQVPATLAAALEKAQAYEEELDMVNEIEFRKQKGKKKVVKSSDEEEEEEEKRKPKKTVLKMKKKEAKVTFDPAHNLDDLTKKFEKMQLNLIQKMEKLTTQVNQQPIYRKRENNRDNSSQNNWNNRNNNRNNRNNNRKTRTCFKCGKEGHISWDCLDRKDNSENSAHAKLVEVEEESKKEEDKLLQHLLDTYDAYLEKRERNDSSDKDTPIKRPRNTNIPEPKLSLNTFGLPKTTSVPVSKVIKTEITSKKNLSWADALEVPSIRKSFFEALRKPKEKEIKLADQEYSLKTTALKCNVAVGAYTVPIIVDSGAAISIIIRDAIEQLGYEIEEASKIIDAATYSLLLGNNWLIKANASYNWSDKELTLRWQGKTLTVPVNCSKETKEEFAELIENTDEENTNKSDTETKLIYPF
ncbi:hypothetical protein Glove_66g179 [Diversispora epigaea]|uniref:CCHC-type domain-containing protein n=1 Tax=Diversispora epigaea TaxID=1348612 RepID=A0A397JBP0_9GLOM|nr:hypothetical protein Glove_66g179 [Diversispora epigaea]